MSDIFKIACLVAIGAFFAWAGSQGSTHTALGVPAFACCVAWAYILNWAVYIPSYIAQTEKFYDLTGSFTFITSTAMAIGWSYPLDTCGTVAAVLVMVWSARLGTFLFRRVLVVGKDCRFDKIKTSWTYFALAWTMQALWIVLTAGCAWVAITATDRAAFGWLGWLGVSVGVCGFVVEVVADEQKAAFRRDARKRAERGDAGFICTGLWRYSRHPNYFGEIVVWVGMALLTAPAMHGAQYALLISPVFVFVLLTYVSGIPMLERKADREFGADPRYQRYKAATAVLVPFVW